MLTNILAAVAITLVTNVVQTDNSSGCSLYHPGVIPLVYGHECKPFIPATERNITTNVLERTKVVVTINGAERIFESERLLSSVTAVLRRLDEWRLSEHRTNSVGSAVLHEPWSGYWTNTNVVILTNRLLLTP